MTIDLTTATKYAAEGTTFDLFQRQEVSRTAGGLLYGKDLGSAIWRLSWTTYPIPNDDAVAFEALLRSLDGVVTPFLAVDHRRIYPRAYPTGNFTDSGTLLSVNVDNQHIALTGLPAGQVISTGDFLSFGNALHQVVSGVTANGSGVTTQFEVRPHIRPGYTLGAAVSLKTPRGQFVLEPDSIRQRAYGSLHTVISFSGVQQL